MRTVLFIAALVAAQAHALSTDRDQPAVIEADEVEMDFRSGLRTYKGNVIVEQGTLYIRGDKMVVKVKDEAMESATVWGSPAKFRQRPDGKDEDVEGEGKKIILNEKDNTLTLITNASLTQGGQTARGNFIAYDMANDTLKVKGLKPKLDDKAKIEAGKTKSGRSRIIIMPRKKSSP